MGSILKNYIFAFIVMAVSGVHILRLSEFRKEGDRRMVHLDARAVGELKDFLPFIYSEVEFRDEKNRERFRWAF